MLGLSSGVIQLRFSEMLTVLPAFTSAAIPGLTIGCLLANLLSGCLALDIIFGSFATLIGALGTYALKKHVFLAPLPPIISNTLIIPFVLRFVYSVPNSLPFIILSVALGEILSCGVLGYILLPTLKKIKHMF